MEEVDFSSFDPSSLCGWYDSIAPIANAVAPSEYQQPLLIFGSGPPSRRMLLFEAARKAIGADIYDYSVQHGEVVAQQIGDCVSWGAKHAIEYLQCVQILMGGWDTYKVIFSPYLYGCGRIYIGGQRGGGDGSVGVWQAQAVIKYGSLSTDTPNLPKYSGNVARQFGSSQNLLDKWQPEGVKHLVKSVAKVKTWDDLVQAITNGYPVTVASSVGYEMKPSSDGFHHRSGRWDHQMEIGMVDDDGGNVEPHAGIVNNWGDVHGSITDFRDPSIKWPPGMLRVRRKDIEVMLAFDDTFAYSGYDGFPAQIVPGMFSSI